MNTPTPKTPGQILFESMAMPCTWQSCTIKYQEHMEASALAVLASQWRPVTEPPENKMPIPSLPPEPIDPYAELRQAFDAGKVIQIWVEGNPSGHWADLTPPFGFKASRDQYRIKPWTLCHLPGFRALEPGEEWHRNDFTEEMLPEGWRPALLGEAFERNGDCDWMNYDGAFEITMGTAYKDCRHTRTRRPLPPTKQELERAEFEAVFRKEDLGLVGSVYTHVGTRHLWEGWQAARKQKEAK